MGKKLLIDSTHPEETRVVLLSGDHLDDFDVETQARKQLKGNLYLGKIVRIEPSLQAAFVDYGGQRHGFLPFNEIHPDYYQIPVEDKEALLAAAANKKSSGKDDEDTADEEDLRSSSDLYQLTKKYKIQEVLSKNRPVLVQVTKEERGNKGATLSTYYSLAGRYCVLMPNNLRAKGGCVSRKVHHPEDRRRLKDILKDIGIAEGITVIIRTAGQDKTKAEIKRDYDYLVHTWNEIRQLTLNSNAPALIYEEGNLIKRSIRDLAREDVTEILVAGEEGFKTAKNFMRMISPTSVSRVKLYKKDISLFQQYHIERHLEDIYQPEVKLKSGAYLVINPTEALVSIDVNSGRSTSTRNIEETALKTNLEAAEEVARQLRLRDLAGLIVIDFIDMEDPKHNSQVEQCMREALRQDRARVQMERISGFGLMELSRQRLRPSISETTMQVCPHCRGSGYIRSVASAAIFTIRRIEEMAHHKKNVDAFIVSVPYDVSLYMLNEKRQLIHNLEHHYNVHVIIRGDNSLLHYDDFIIEPLVRDKHGALSLSGKQNPRTLKDLAKLDHAYYSKPPKFGSFWDRLLKSS